MNQVEHEQKLEFLIEQAKVNDSTWSLAMGKYGENELKLLDGTVEFCYKVIQVIGVIAGFGFTGVGFVKSHALFVIGEMILLAALIYGLFQIRRFYLTNLSAIQAGSNKARDLFQKVADVYTEWINGFTFDADIDHKPFLKKLDEANASLLAGFTGGQEKKPKNIDMVNGVMILFALGAFILLLSFAISC